jgi:tetratricopeptide (TPR) repeat protein
MFVIRKHTEESDAKLVDRAHQLIKDSNHDKAYSILSDIVKRTPQKYVNQFKKDGKLFIKFWDLNEFTSYTAQIQEKSELQRVVWLPNAYPRAYFYLGYLHIEKEEYEKAINYLDKGLVLEPANATLLNEKTQGLVKLNKYDEALAICDTVLETIEFVPQNRKATCLRSKGYILIEECKLSEAEKCYLDCLKIEPDNKMAISQLQIIRNALYCKNEADRQSITDEEFKYWYWTELSTGRFLADKVCFNGININIDQDNKAEFQDRIREDVKVRMLQFLKTVNDCFSSNNTGKISREEFTRWLYCSYMGYCSVMTYGRFIYGPDNLKFIGNENSNWNEGYYDGLAREVGALTETEIEDAKTDLNQAVLSRVKIRLFMEGEKAFDPQESE